MAEDKEQPTQPPFYVKDCALAAIATGNKAQTLGEFRDQLKLVPAESLYFHFWRHAIETSLVPGSYLNDFSHWAHNELHDDILAERLALLDPSEYEDMEKLRSDILDIVEGRLDEQDGAHLFFQAEAFHFIKSKIIVFNTAFVMEHPRDLVKIVPELSTSSLFYHFIDARKREIIAQDDFSTWLAGFGEEFAPLINRFKQIDPYFIPLADLHKKLSSTVVDYFLGKGAT